MSEEQKEVQTTEREKAVNAAAEKNAALGEKVGPRYKVGSTKGKNPIIIEYLNFDDSKPATLPKTPQEFTEVVTNDPKLLLEYMIRGYNDAMYEAASDPLSEYVSSVWSPEVALTFRTAVRNYAKGLGLELEQAVNIIRPGFAAKFGA